MPLGTYGQISVAEARNSTKRKPVYIAKARFGDSDGETRSVTRTGQTKAAARTALTVALSKRQRAAQASAVNDATTVRELATTWLTHGQDSGQWSTGTIDTYTLALKHVTARLGGVKVGQLSAAVVNTALQGIAADHGPGIAKTCRSVLSGMCKHAVAYGALTANPVRDALPIRRPRAKKPRALTVPESEDLLDWIRTDRRSVDWDLPDLVEWMLATGCRIGEACAARSDVNDDGAPLVDLTAGTWEIDATVTRIPKVGLTVQRRPKTAAGWRVLALPPQAVDIIRRRATEHRLTPVERVYFGAPAARSLRDKSNTAADLRTVLDAHGLDFVTSHTFRKTVATRLLEAGLPPQTVADHMGHSRPSMTLDHYAGRNVVSAAAAAVLAR